MYVPHLFSRLKCAGAPYTSHQELLRLLPYRQILSASAPRHRRRRSDLLDVFLTALHLRRLPLPLPTPTHIACPRLACFLRILVLLILQIQCLIIVESR